MHPMEISNSYSCWVWILPQIDSIHFSHPKMQRQSGFFALHTAHHIICVTWKKLFQSDLGSVPLKIMCCDVLATRTQSDRCDILEWLKYEMECSRLSKPAFIWNAAIDSLPWSSSSWPDGNGHIDHDHRHLLNLHQALAAINSHCPLHHVALSMKVAPTPKPSHPKPAAMGYEDEMDGFELDLWLCFGPKSAPFTVMNWGAGLSNQNRLRMNNNLWGLGLSYQNPTSYV